MCEFQFYKGEAFQTRMHYTINVISYIIHTVLDSVENLLRFENVANRQSDTNRQRYLAR
jgi:hypothetical protein